MKLSKRIQELQASPIRKLVPFAEKAKKEGKKVYHLNIGQPDIKTPPEFMEAVRGFSSDVISYSLSQGDPKLINAISQYYTRCGMDFKDSEILITNGGSEALLFSLVALCDYGDEVLVPEPFYTNYSSFCGTVGVTIKPITTRAEDGFHLPSKAIIKSLVNSKTRAILFSNPGNPTGVVYSKKELEILAEISIEKDIFLIGDEVYREFTYDGYKAVSIGEIDGIADRTIIIDSVSKRYSACGARIGSICTKNKDVIREVTKICQGRLCVPTLEQVGAAALYSVSESYLEDVNKEYNKRRDIAFKYLSKMDGVICEKPMGAFYIIAKLPIADAEDFVLWLLTEFHHNNETVMFAPAQDFYISKEIGKNEVRMAYVLEEQDLIRAMKLLQIGLKEYKKIKS